MLLIFTAFAASSQLSKLFHREAMYGHFSGVTMVETKKGERQFFTYGGSDTSVPIHSNTRFDIGSITKQFTAAAILHLVYNEKLQLQDRINEYLGDYQSDDWDKVTIHQLLTHTSGIPSLYQTEQGLDIYLPEEKPIERADLINLFRVGKLLFKPGEEFSYSNSGYILLATIVENITNQTFENYLSSMFERYELTNTSLKVDKESALPFYGYRDDLVRKAPVYHYSWFVGGGGVYSTVEDLSKWIDVIVDSDFLNEDLRDKFLRPYTNQGYGYGWVHMNDRIFHDGANAGFISRLEFDPDTGEKVILLTNRSFEPIEMLGKSADYIKELSDKCWGSLQGEELEILPEIKKLDITEATSFMGGIVIDEMDSTLSIKVENNYPSRMLYNMPLSVKYKSGKKMLDIANFLKKKKYWSFARYCDGEVKFVCYSGMMSIGMRMMKSQTGGVDEIVPYYVEESHGILRMKGPKGILDLIVYFDDEGDVQGVFEHGFYESDKEIQMVAYPIGSSLYYLDGLPYGEKSATIRITTDAITFYQLGRSVSFARLPD